MPSVPKINVEQNRIDVLAYAVRNKAGKMSELRKVDASKGEQVDELITAGFIKTGYTRKYKTWGITKLGKGFFEETGLASKYANDSVQTVVPTNPTLNTKDVKNSFISRLKKILGI